MLTVAYGAYALARPEHLTRQASIDPARAPLIGRALGVRDVVSGLAITAVSAPSHVQAALRVRLLLDLTDVALFGALARTRAGRTRAVLAALSWTAIATTLARAHHRAHAPRRHRVHRLADDPAERAR